MRASLVQTIFVAVLVGAIFFNIGNTQADVQNALGALYFVIINQVFITLSQEISLCKKFFWVFRVIFV